MAKETNMVRAVLEANRASVRKIEDFSKGTMASTVEDRNGIIGLKGVFKVIITNVKASYVNVPQGRVNGQTNIADIGISIMEIIIVSISSIMDFIMGFFVI